MIGVPILATAVMYGLVAVFMEIRFRRLFAKFDRLLPRGL
jgi:hypothetical protein